MKLLLLCLFVGVTSVAPPFDDDIDFDTVFDYRPELDMHASIPLFVMRELQTDLNKPTQEIHNKITQFSQYQHVSLDEVERIYRHVMSQVVVPEWFHNTLVNFPGGPDVNNPELVDLMNKSAKLNSSGIWRNSGHWRAVLKNWIAYCVVPLLFNSPVEPCKRETVGIRHPDGTKSYFKGWMLTREKSGEFIADLIRIEELKLFSIT